MKYDVDSVVAEMLCLLQEMGATPVLEGAVNLDSVQALSDCINVSTEQKLLLQSLKFVLALREGNRALSWSVLGMLEAESRFSTMTGLLSELLENSYIERPGAEMTFAASELSSASIHEQLRREFTRGESA